MRIENVKQLAALRGSIHELPAERASTQSPKLNLIGKVVQSME